MRVGMLIVFFCLGYDEAVIAEAPNILFSALFNGFSCKALDG